MKLGSPDNLQAGALLLEGLLDPGLGVGDFRVEIRLDGVPLIVAVPF